MVFRSGLQMACLEFPAEFIENVNLWPPPLKTTGPEFLLGTGNWGLISSLGDSDRSGLGALVLRGDASSTSL